MYLFYRNSLFTFFILVKAEQNRDVKERKMERERELVARERIIQLVWSIHRMSDDILKPLQKKNKNKTSTYVYTFGRLKNL